MKNAVLILLFLLMGCKGTLDEDRNVEVARGIFDAFNDHDWQKLISFYAADAVFEDPAFAQPVRNNQFIVEHHAALQASFPDIHDSIVGLYPSGNTVTVEFISTGTISSGEKFSLPICTIFTFKDGRVIRDATYYDKE